MVTCELLMAAYKTKIQMESYFTSSFILPVHVFIQIPVINFFGLLGQFKTVLFLNVALFLLVAHQITKFFFLFIQPVQCSAVAHIFFAVRYSSFVFVKKTNYLVQIYHCSLTSSIKTKEFISYPESSTVWKC